jgi:hypothetical protein
MLRLFTARTQVTLIYGCRAALYREIAAHALPTGLAYRQALR